jgi:CheY-like chemotaxis protein
MTPSPSAARLSAFRHSVRSELNQIVGYAELLAQDQGSALPPLCAERLREIQEAARRLLQAFQMILGSDESADLLGHLHNNSSIIRPLETLSRSITSLLNDLPGEFLADLQHIQHAYLDLRDLLHDPARHSPKSTFEPSSPVIAPTGPYSAFVPREAKLRGKVLVIDDSEANRALLERQLREIGLEVTSVPSGPAGLAELAENKYDCVLLDMVIPEMDGPAVLRAIRTNPEWMSTPVLMLSALDELREAAHCIEIGAEDYLLRPVELTLLRAKLYSSISRKLLYEDCQQLGKDLASTNEDLKRFLLVASHDLQAPLRTLEHNLSSLNGLPVAQQSLELCRRMNTLVQDLLLYARLGQVPPFIEEIPLDWVLAEATANLREAIVASEAVVEYSQLPKVKADFKQMLYLFQNLISNAIRYRSPLPPEVRIAATDRDTHWLISVRDNGRGIPEDQLEKIFDPFHRLHGDEIPGTGLGLAIAKRAVEQARGRIWADSIPSGGSTFWILLPKA